ALDQGTETLKRIRELAQDAANDSKTSSERANIAKEVQQLREHLQSIANTKNSNKYIFNGTDTTTPPVIDESKMNLGLDHLDDTNVESVELVYEGQVFRYKETEDGNYVFQAEGRTRDVQLIISQDADERTVTYFEEPVPNPDPNADPD